jgi:magnesium chelatase family protein
MSYGRVFGAQTFLLAPQIVTVETDLSRGLHSFSVVGLPDKAVEEARDRVSSAIKHAGFESPKSLNKKIVVSLAPADLKKEGPLFDLPIALSYLLAAGLISFDPQKFLFAGELSLDGRLRGVRGILPLASLAKDQGFAAIFVPRENAREAALVEGITVFGADTLTDVVNHLNEKREARIELTPMPRTELPDDETYSDALDDIRGQAHAKRALMIAAAGGHHVGLWGPPGTGKTLLARALSSILPKLNREEALEVTGIHSVAGALRGDLVTRPPMRSPHHTSSYVSLVGGGVYPRPGEITLAHRGVLFLDEFPEFDRRVIEALRQPLEERFVSISRAKGTAQFPAQISLVVAMNPCPCGNYGSSKACICPQGTLQKYQRKISGPIADRIDLWVMVSPVEYSELGKESEPRGETEAARRAVASARMRQHARLSAEGKSLNSQLSAKDIGKLAPLTREVRSLLDTAAERLGLSPRSYHRVIKVARTIADLDASEEITQAHLLEAIEYRPRDFLR